MRPISYELNGFPEFLHSEQACRRAIDRGAVRADTPIVAYGEDGERRRMPAKDHPLLREMFAVGAPDPVPGPPGPVSPPAVVAPAPTRRATPAPSPAVAPPPERQDPAADRPPADRPPAADRNDTPFRSPLPGGTGQGGSGKLVGVVILLVVVGLVLVALATLGKRDGTNETAGGETVAENMATMVDGTLTNEEAPAEASQTLYAVRDVTLRTGPSTGSSSVGLVPRGSILVGVPGEPATPSESGWLRVTEGTYRDRYASMANLSTTTRPELDTANAGTWYVSQALTPLQEPSDSAPRKAGDAWQLAGGSAVDVAGTTGAGAFTTGWAEVRLEREGGVGYVPLDRLTRTPPLDEGSGDGDGEGPADADGSSAAAAAGAVLYLESACRRDFDVVLRVREAGGTEMDSAHLPANGTTPFLVNGSVARLVSDEASYANLADGGDAGETGVTFRGRAYSLSKLRMVRDSQGNLHARFTC